MENNKDQQAGLLIPCNAPYLIQLLLEKSFPDTLGFGGSVNTGSMLPRGCSWMQLCAARTELWSWGTIYSLQPILA